MTSGDRKGDTARGARAVANASARRWDKEDKARKAKAVGVGLHNKLASQVTGRTGIVPVPQPKPKPQSIPKSKSSPPVAIDTADPIAAPSATPDASAAAKFTIKEADLEDLSEVYQSMFVSVCDDRDGWKQREVYGKEAEVGRKQVDEMIRDLFTTVGFNRIILPDNRVAEECRGTTESTISATRLLELGVDADTVAAAKVPGKPYFFVKVRPMTDKEKEARELRMAARSPQEVVAQ